MPATIEIDVLPAGIQRIGLETQVQQQFVIPRYYDGVNHPAGIIEGRSARSILQASSTTQNLASTPDDLRWIVQTEGYPFDISGWQETVSGKQPACLQPILRNLTIAGFPDGGYNPNSPPSYINVRPNVQNIGTATLYGGFRGFGSGGIVDNVTFFYIPGTALFITRPLDSGQTNSLPHDRLKWSISRINVRRVFEGVLASATDSVWNEIEVQDFRDYAFKVPGNVGGIQFGNVHTYGGGYIGGPGGGAGIWIQGSNNQSNGPLYAENSPIGLRVDGTFNIFQRGVFSHTCATNNIVVTEKYNTISGFDCDGGAVCILYQGATSNINTLQNGLVFIPVGGIGLKIESPLLMTVQNVLIHGTHAARHAHGAISSNPTAKGIVITGAISRSTIQADIDGGGTGIDMSGATITNDGNIILIRTANIAAPVLWPSSGNWVTTVNAAETCDVRINGVRYYRP